MTRAINGNIQSNSILSIIHWIAGSKLWNNKILELETLMNEKKPDLCYISEANLWDYMDDYERHITVYNLILPKSMSNLKHVRIVLLVQDNLEV